ncbi:MAG TPA: SAM-dependent methyltransferase, partial [Actinomycetota bacterium]|nr:SAM-dependent methyltransferase [Actinomycetota bacterium]
MSAPFEAGEKVLLIDQRERTYLFSLQAGATYHTHAGTLAHDDLIGRPEGTRVTTARGMVLAAFRPRFSDYVLKMPRGAQVVYPKDLGPIVVYADVYPGARVLEAGTGSGALTIALCRAVGEQGHVTSYELRPEHRERAQANIEGFFGKIPDTLEMRDGDVTDAGSSGDRFDRL